MKIKVTDTEKLDTAILAAEGRATARCINSTDVSETVSAIERKLSAIMNKGEWQGMEFLCDPNGQSFPGAYKGIPESTRFKLLRGSSCWFVTEIKRAHCAGPSQRIQPLNLDSKAEAILAFLKQSKNW